MVSNMEKISLLEMNIVFFRGSPGDRLVSEIVRGDISSANPKFCLGGSLGSGGGRFRPEEVAGIDESEVYG